VRKNVFLKSMFRQKLRSLLVFLLIGLAAFGFVLRAVEYVVVREQIMRAAEFYQSAGFISSPVHFGDVSDGIRLIEASPYIGFQDGRRAAQGFIEGVQNADVTGMHTLSPHFEGFRYIQPTITETYFYGYLELLIRHMPHVRLPGQPFVQRHHLLGRQMQFRVCEVVVGHPEYVTPGQVLRVTIPIETHIDRRHLWDMVVGERYFVRASYLRQYFNLNQLWRRTDLWLPLPRHGAPQELAPALGNPLLVPQVGDSNDVVTIRPLHVADAPEDYIWYLHTPTGTRADFDDPRLEHIPGDIAMLDANQRNILLQTTRNMSAMHQVGDVIRLFDGRFLDYNDHRQNNPVVVIDHGFASMRGINVGDSLTISVPMHQYFVGALAVQGFGVPFVRHDHHNHERMQDAESITLEVVGITYFATMDTAGSQSLVAFIPDSIMPERLFIEMPHQVLRYGQWIYLPGVQFGADHIPDAWYGFNLVDSRYYEYFMNDYWLAMIDYNLDLVVIHMDSTNFWESANPVLLAVTFNAGLFGIILLMVLGLCTFLFLRARFRDLAIMRAIGTKSRRVLAHLLAAIIFISIPAIAIGGAGAWFFAINEAEATLAEFGDVYEDTIPPTPTELIWRELFGDRPMPGMIELEVSHMPDLAASLDIIYLVIFLSIIFVITLLMTIIGGAKILASPILALLQGNSAKRGKIAAPKFILGQNIRPHPTLHNTINRALSEQDRFYDKNRIHPNKLYTIPPPPPPKINIPTTIPDKRRGNILTNALIWLRRHIMRAPVKSALGAGVALLFMVALGWLQGSIDTTYAQIERVMDTTVVRATIAANPDVTRTRHVDDTITNGIVRRLLNTGYVYQIYREAAYIRSIVVAPCPEGSLPITWRFNPNLRRANDRILLDGAEVARTPDRRVPYFEFHMIHNRNNLDFILAIDCIDTFLRRHNISGMDLALVERAYFDEDGYFYTRMEELPRPAHIWLYPQNCPSVFDEPTEQGGPIPIIIPMRVAEARGLWFGDDALVAFEPPLEMGRFDDAWPYVHAVIVGVHNSQIHISNMSNAVIMPHWAYQNTFGAFSRYIYLDIGINPAYNRMLPSVRDEFSMIINNLLAADADNLFAPTPFTMDFRDSELRNTLSALDTVLTLLELLYPVAIVVSIVIGASLAMLLTLQNTKNAAVMRVLGASRRRTAFMIWCEQITICIAGLILGIAAMALLGLAAPQIATLSALYLAGAILGGTIGALTVTNKAPLDLLQVRE